MNGATLFDSDDVAFPLLDGAAALFCEEGYLSTAGIMVRPVRENS